MDKITDAKTEFRLKQWSKIIQACQTSGMTVTNWCSQNNVKIKSYYYWLRKIRTLAYEAGTLAPHKTEQKIVPVPFHQAKVSPAVTIHLSSFCVDIHNGASSETIEAVLSVLKSIC
jgi:hypothetical protein